MCRALVVVRIFLRVEAQRLTKWSAVWTLVGQWTGKSQDPSESEGNRHLVCSPLFVHKKHAWRIAISVCSHLCHIVCVQNSTPWKGCVFCMARVHLFNELNLRKRAPLKQVGVGKQEPLGYPLQHVFRELGSSRSGSFER